MAACYSLYRALHVTETTTMRHEFFFLIKDRAALLWMTIAFISAMMAVLLGLSEVYQQRTALAELQKLDRVERELSLGAQSDWGNAAYYTFHLTYDPPSDFAFAAFGERDVSPWKHRIRMLALEGQIYETDADNPDFALIGRFDYSFVAALLTPLLIILLLYDLRSGELAAGRLNLIKTSSGQAKRVWLMRSILRLGGLYLALLIPLWIGGVIEGTSTSTLLSASLALLIYTLFWGVLVYLIANERRTGSANLTYLTGIWLLVCAVLPALLVLTVNKSVSLPNGGDIVLTQREAVNDAWDIPKDVTYKAFLERHPIWTDFTGWDGDKGFEWKWYYAFQQVGDQKAEALSQNYRKAREQRDALIGKASFISPASLLQRQLETLAHTDMKASLAYEESIRDYHKQLRKWHYPRIFSNKPFSSDAALAEIPKYQNVLERK